MKPNDVLVLARSKYAEYRTQSRIAIVIGGILFGVVLSILAVTQGLENTAMRYAGAKTGGTVYLAVRYDGRDSSKKNLDRVNQYGGMIVSTSPEEYINALDFKPQYIVSFTSFDRAYDYYSIVRSADARDYQMSEINGNQIATHQYFETLNKNIVHPICITITTISVIILTLTLAHLLAQDKKTFILYNMVGASKMHILEVYLVFLLRLCIAVALLAAVVSLIVSITVTLFAWNHIVAGLTATYGNTSTFTPILIGINRQYLEVILLVIMTAPISVLLCIDQFNTKKIIAKLKKEQEWY